MSYRGEKRGPKIKWPYDEEIAEEICRRISEGDILERICNEDGFPSRWVVSKWRIEQPDFNEAIKVARMTRAEYYFDKVIELAETANSRDDVYAASIKISAYKWGAQIGDPGTFGIKAHENQKLNEKPIYNIHFTGKVEYTDEDRRLIQQEVDKLESPKD